MFHCVGVVGDGGNVNRDVLMRGNEVNTPRHTRTYDHCILHVSGVIHDLNYMN